MSIYTLKNTDGKSITGTFIDNNTIFKTDQEEEIPGTYIDKIEAVVNENTNEVEIPEIPATFTVTKDGVDEVWTVTEEKATGGRKRRSSKKYKKGGNKHTIGGRKSKKCKKGGKRSSKKSRRY
jgi:hypothetical protein